MAHVFGLINWRHKIGGYGRVQVSKIIGDLIHVGFLSQPAFWKTVDHSVESVNKLDHDYDYDNN